jgi:hypothetical protein
MRPVRPAACGMCRHGGSKQARTARFYIRLAARRDSAVRPPRSPLPGLNWIPTYIFFCACCRGRSIHESQSLHLFARFFSWTPTWVRLVVADMQHIYGIQQFLHRQIWQIHISVRYTGPHLTTALRGELS